MGALSPMHWAIIIILVLLLFGSRRLPDMARGVGQSLRIFKAETQELRGEGAKSDESGSASTAASGASAPAVEQGGTAAAQHTAPAAETSTTTDGHAGGSR